MKNIDQAKERLSSALSRINTKLIEAQTLMHDYKELEKENHELKANALLLKKEVADLKTQLRNISIEQEQKTITKIEENYTLKSEKNDNTPHAQTDFALEFSNTDETEVSLNELKGLLGNKR